MAKPWVTAGYYPGGPEGDWATCAESLTRSQAAEFRDWLRYMKKTIKDHPKVGRNLPSQVPLYPRTSGRLFLVTEGHIEEVTP